MGPPIERYSFNGASLGDVCNSARTACPAVGFHEATGMLVSPIPEPSTAALALLQLLRLECWCEVADCDPDCDARGLIECTATFQAHRFGSAWKASFSCYKHREPMVMSRRAFTLVELLVAIGIIGVLVALLFPSFRRAGDSRGVQCRNNLKQVGLAAITFHDTHTPTPPKPT